MALLDLLFTSDGLTPHGYCLLWDPALIWLHLASDAAIAAAYLAIPAALAVVGRRRPDLNPHGVLYWFAAFIILCAATHLLSIVTLWQPWYVLSAIVKVICGAVSIVTAALVWRILKYVLGAPSHREVAAANEELRRLNDALEQRVTERTTEVSAANERLIAAVYASREADRIKADFMARMSHELRTPLNAIIGFCEMLQAGVGGPLADRQRDYCGNIHAAGLQLLQQISDILDLERLSEGAELPEPVDQDLRAACAEAVARMQTTAREAGVSVDVAVPDGVSVWADRRALQTILINLVSNAVKYSPGGTRVQITAAVEDDDLRISVTDRGFGVAAERLPRVFEPFYRAHERELPSVGGSGLGLSLVRMLVDAHRGRLDFHSRQDEGTTVTVWLPSEGSSRARTAADIPPPPSPGGLQTDPLVV